MRVLVLAEHDNAELKPQTLHAVTAAAQLGDVDVLVAGADCQTVADAAAAISGVAGVRLCDDARYGHRSEEHTSDLQSHQELVWRHPLEDKK